MAQIFHQCSNAVVTGPSFAGTCGLEVRQRATFRLRTAILTVLLCFTCSSASNARVKHGHYDKPHQRHRSVAMISIIDCSDPVMRPCYPGGTELTSSAGQNARRRKRSSAPKPMGEGLRRILSEGAGRAVGVVRSASGATAHVASHATSAFQCLVDELDRQGYPIHFMGGWRAYGSVRRSLHPAGLALDINQYARNRTRPRMPNNEIALANACGLISGAQWANGDSGHFQFGGWSGHGRRRAMRGHRLHRQYARAR